MNPPEIVRVFNDVGAILLDGHFVYTSGRHGSGYVNKDALYPHTAQVRALCEVMAAPFRGQHIDTVVGPTLGGIILSQWVAHDLSLLESREITACFAEERVNAAGEKERYFGRGYEQWIRDRRVLVVEDILTTGGSVRQVVDAVRRSGGTPVAVTALCNRGGVESADVGNVPLHALLSLTLESWNAIDCPLCAQGIPISTAVGKGSKRS